VTSQSWVSTKINVAVLDVCYTQNRGQAPICACVVWHVLC
jgi:hypothetical protein